MTKQVGDPVTATVQACGPAQNAFSKCWAIPMLNVRQVQFSVFSFTSMGKTKTTVLPIKDYDRTDGFI